MYSITFNGAFETEKPEDFLKKLQEIAEDTDTNFVGHRSIYKLADYVDYQKCEVADANSEETTSKDNTDSDIQHGSKSSEG